MLKEERKVVVFEQVDEAITALRLIRSRVQKGLHIDPSDFLALKEMMESLRHSCEMHNEERLIK